jgi:hypothetical protein
MLSQDISLSKKIVVVKAQTIHLEHANIQKVIDNYRNGNHVQA